jgi:prepilin-type N-terminal cleavage/methylation domain-containing protein
MLRRESAGFSLVELMVALVIGLGITLCMSSFYQSLLRVDLRAMSRLRLQQGVQVLLDVMERDLLRAGYRAYRPGMKQGLVPPSLYLAPGCLVVLIDLDGDGQQSGEQEIRGYRFNESSQHLEVRSWLRSRGQASSFCHDSGWQDMTDGQILVSNFQLLPVVAAGTSSRLYQLSLEARDARYPDLEVRHERWLWLRNQ